MNDLPNAATLDAAIFYRWDFSSRHISPSKHMFVRLWFSIAALSFPWGGFCCTCLCTQVPHWCNGGDSGPLHHHIPLHRCHRAECWEETQSLLWDTGTAQKSCECSICGSVQGQVERGNLVYWMVSLSVVVGARWSLRLLQPKPFNGFMILWFSTYWV